MGRFINRDPIGYVDGLNLYRGYFVPLLSDPTGLIGGGRRQYEDCHNRFKEAIDSVKDQLQNIADSGCPVPGIYCTCCDGEGAGYYDILENNIYICTNTFEGIIPDSSAV